MPSTAMSRPCPSPLWHPGERQTPMPFAALVDLPSFGGRIDTQEALAFIGQAFLLGGDRY